MPLNTNGNNTDNMTSFNSQLILLNVVKSPPDNRDRIYKSTGSRSGSDNTPDGNILSDHRNKLLSCRNQGSQGTCAAQVAACMKEYQEELNEYCSPQFFYSLRSNLTDTDPTNDEGMYPRDVMKLLKNVGMVLEKHYPYGIIEPRDKIPESLMQRAKRYCIKAYARIDSMDELKESLLNNGPCLIAFPVFNYNSEFWKQNSGDENLGGHAVTVVGCTENAFIIRNSWGTFWGDNGYCYYPFDDWGAHWEIWTTVDDLSNNGNTFKDDQYDNKSQKNNSLMDSIFKFIISMVSSFFSKLSTTYKKVESIAKSMRGRK